MSELLDKINNIINQNIPEIKKDLVSKLNRLEDLFVFGDEEVVVFVEGHSYQPVASIVVSQNQVIVKFKDGFTKPLDELDSSSILVIYEYVILSD